MKSLFIFFLLLFLNRIALTKETLTFDRALGMAMKKNHQIEVARNNAAIAENNATIGNADLLPNLNLSGGTSVSNREGEESTTTQALLSTSYALFDGFGNVYRFKRLQAGKRLGNLEARDAIESTLLQVSQAYYSASLTFENLRIANDLMTISRERFIRTRKRSDFGQARTIDVLAAQVDLNADSVTMVQARFQWDEARRNLNILLNRDVETDFLVDTAVVFLQALNPETLMAEALNQNASYLS